MLLLIGIILFKLPFRSDDIIGARVINLIPLEGSLNEHGIIVGREIALNILLFVPLGIYLRVLKSRWTFPQKALAIALVSLSFEVIQLLFAMGITDVTDLIANTLGGVLGIAISAAMFGLFKGKTVKILQFLALIVTIGVVLRFGHLFYLSHVLMPANSTQPVMASPTVAATKTPAPTLTPPTTSLQATHAAPDVLLVNAQNPLPRTYVPENLVNLYAQDDRRFELARSDIELCQSVYEAMNAMFVAAKKDGVEGFIISSGYRSYEAQAEVYANSPEGIAAAPGTSEHETGLAFDVTARGNSHFELTPQFAWLSKHCAAYGFILRYPKDKEDITGIAYEPWHYRYVGMPHAQEMKDAGITLEEYLATPTPRY